MRIKLKVAVEALAVVDIVMVAEVSKAQMMQTVLEVVVEMFTV